MSNPWFRLYKEFATDPVVQSLAFEDQRHYIIILCMKCDGLLDRNIMKSARDRIIFRTLGLDPISGEEAKKRLEEVALIDKNWSPRTWNKRQFLSDHSTERTRKYRKNKETGNGNESTLERHCDGPDTDTDTDTEKPMSKRSKKTNGHDEDSEKRFELFWSDYPRKEKKKQSKVSFMRLSKTKQQKAIDDIQGRFDGMKRDYIPLPSSYINGERWDDETGANKQDDFSNYNTGNFV